jgi:hypothetical protein
VAVDSVQGTETVTTADTLTAGGSGSWALTELGSYGGYSVALSSVVYQEGGSGSGTVQESATDAIASTDTSSANDSATGSAVGSMGLSGTGGQDTTAATASVQLTGFSQANVSLTDAGSGTFSLYLAGSYAGESFAFSSLTYGASGTDTLTANLSVSAGGCLSQTGTDSFAGTNNASGSYGSTTQSSQQSAAYDLSGTWALGGTVTGHFTLSATDCFTLSVQGSYGNDSFALSSFVLGAADSLSWGGTQTVTASLQVSDSGTQGSTITSAHTAAVNFGANQCFSQMTVSGTDHSNLSSSLGDTLSASETTVLTPSGSAGDALYEAGVYGGGSFSLSSLSYSGSWQYSNPVTDAGSVTAADSSSNGYADAGTDTGASPGDSANWSRSQSYSAQSTVTESYGANDSSGFAFALTEAGTYGGGSTRNWGRFCQPSCRQAFASQVYRPGCSEHGFFSVHFRRKTNGPKQLTVASPFVPPHVPLDAWGCN